MLSLVKLIASASYLQHMLLGKFVDLGLSLISRRVFSRTRREVLSMSRHHVLSADHHAPPIVKIGAQIPA